MIFDTHANILNHIAKKPKANTVSTYHLPQALEGHITGGIWTYAPSQKEDIEVEVSHILNEIHAVDEIHVVKSKDDWDSDDFNIVLGLQDISFLKDKVTIHHAFELGFRHAAIALTENIFATGGDSQETTGLTPVGRRLVHYMNSLGMVIDVTGANKQTFHDVLHETELPVIVSSANCYEIMPSQYNLQDSQIKEIANTGGFIGITTRFNSVHSTKPSVETLVDHIDYLKSLVGCQHISLGFNFPMESTRTVVNECESPNQAISVIDELYKRKYSTTDIEAIASNNAKRVINQVLKAV